jgi:hypothetical protein
MQHKVLNTELHGIEGATGREALKVPQKIVSFLEVLDAAFLIAKGRTQPLDLMTVSQPRQPPRTRRTVDGFGNQSVGEGW